MSTTQKLTFDDGLVRLDINDNGTLVFNPSDFNLYGRFSDLLQELPELARKYEEATGEQSDGGDSPLPADLEERKKEIARRIDSEIKAKLNAVFGAPNDFDKLLGGMNVMSRGHNGEYILANLLNALLPHLESGAKKHMAGEVKAAKLNREQRRAAQRGNKKA